MWFLLCLLWVAIAGSTTTGYSRIELEHLGRGTVRVTLTTGLRVVAPVQGQHFAAFPRALGRIVVLHNVTKLDWSATQGRWFSDLWGPPQRAAPTGLVVRASFHPSTPDVHHAWTGVVAALSTLLAVPVGDMEAATVSELAVPRTQCATVPLTDVCGHHLTRWQRLLPCRTGVLAQLAAAQVLLHGMYISISVNVDTEASPAGYWQLNLTLTSVHRSVAADGQAVFRQLFGQSLPPLTAASPPCPFMAPLELQMRLRPGDIVRTDPAGTTLSGAEVPAGLRDVFIMPASISAGPLGAASVRMFRALEGEGLTWRQLVVRLDNTMGATATNLTLHQVFPWHMRVYGHTVRVTGDVTAVQQLFAPAGHRYASAQLLVQLHLSAHGSATIVLDIEPRSLRLAEFPPDPHRGVDVAPAKLQAAHGTSVYQLYSDPMVLYLPLPDFSMPYNVIAISSTLLAIVFGTVLKLATRMYLTQPGPHKPAVPAVMLGKAMAENAN